MEGVPLALQAGASAGPGSAAATSRVPPGLIPSSSSRSVTETVNGSHDFKIGGYSLAKGMGIGKYITSETFKVGGYEWAVYFYPDGKNLEDNSLYVSVFIALASEGTDVRALFELTLLDQSGKGKHKVHSHFDRALESGPYTLKYRGSMWGYKRFFKRAVLETSDYIKDDTLALTCTVGVVVSSTGPKLYSIPVPDPDIGLHLGELLDSGINSDITFEVDGDIFNAHKLVLAARSPVFKAQLFGVMREKESSVIQVKDIEAPVFKAMLYFMYRDCLPEDCELSGSASPATCTVMAQHLLAAADRYGLDRLRIICEAKLCQEVNVETVATTLALAEQHHSAQLKAVCLKFVAANLAAVIRSDGYEHLKESCPSLQCELLKAVAGVEVDAEVEIPVVVNKKAIIEVWEKVF
ncbi:hypothetical protein GOP47_0007540 [Adiantum capillus-veneris]|uniref:BTB/POZ and MATH domain-containing protein 3 n=1 Tax=Adiantum capillus-veneris TaxID=13818 RepID=A0A9D4V0W8_ADICA|nr:hypothetical protein GOP47_0007540 [Adiantum capillus-veneris]